MANTFVLKVALRYLKPSRKEGFLSVIAGFSFLGITLGVATLIIVMSVMNGFREDLFNRILGFNGHIGVASVYREGLKNFDHLVTELKNIPEVATATPMIESQVMITNKGMASGALVHGLRLKDLLDRKLVSDHITHGTLDHFDQENAIIIGKRLAEKYHLFPGDSLSLVAPEGTSTAFGTVPRIRRFQVVAIFDVGMKEYDGSVVFIPLEAAQNFFRLPEAVNGIEVFLHHPDQATYISRLLNQNLGPSVRVIDWQRANSSFTTALQVERNVMFTILTLIVLVAAFNIISSMIMLVKDKTHDIAILRTMGASQSMIMRIFFFAGSLIGIIGTATGSLLGLLITSNIESIRQWLENLSGTQLFSAEVYFLTKLPSKVDPYEVITVVSIALLLVFLASLYPSWRAARLDPVEALRYE
ncbi:multidrug ABC transporter substrate-binding protein [Candidatus Paracaedimonas acanthamoebae]|nr:multidrug ABC transporter substrate-binding protein [Candidatus Paracaedimonas acanthamoebae]